MIGTPRDTPGMGRVPCRELDEVPEARKALERAVLADTDSQVAAVQALAVLAMGRR